MLLELSARATQILELEDDTKLETKNPPTVPEVCRTQAVIAKPESRSPAITSFAVAESVRVRLTGPPSNTIESVIPERLISHS